MKTPTEGKRRFPWVLSILICFAFLPVGLIVWEKAREEPEPILPSPNGYTVMLNAAAQLQGPLDFQHKFSETELADYVRKNAPIHREAAKALEYQSRIPVQYTQAYLATHSQELALSRLLAWSLAREGKFLETQGKYPEAAERYLQILGHAQQCTRGGFLIDGISAATMELFGMKPLESTGRNLPVDAAKKAANQLEEIDRYAPPLREILLEERRFYERAHGWKDKLAALMSSQESPETKFEQRFKDRVRQRRQLMVNLAARAYELEKSEKPKDVSALVPEFLKAVAVDPEKNSPLQPTW